MKTSLLPNSNDLVKVVVWLIIGRKMLYPTVIADVSVMQILQNVYTRSRLCEHYIFRREFLELCNRELNWWVHYL